MRISIHSAGIILTCLNILCFFIEYLTAAALDAAEGKNQQNLIPLIPETVNLVKYENTNIGVDGYAFAFETSDGVYRKETATVKNPGTKEEAISVEGTVSWVGPDGIHYTLNYLADENGFQPEGKHLPVAPEVPATS